VAIQEEIGFGMITYARLGVTPVEEKLVQHRLMVWTYPAEAPIHNGVIRRTGNEKRDRGQPNLTWKESVKRYLKD
jgi:hypothetical protein